MNEFEKVIKTYLDEVAAKDIEFSKKYNARKLIDKNCILQCCSYIINTVKQSGRKAFHDDEIYGMAIHFFDEGLTNDGKAPNCKIVVPTAEKTTAAAKPKVQKPVKKQPQDDCQLSLF